MSESGGDAAAAAATDRSSGRSWKKMLLQAVIFQVVMRFLSSRVSQRQPQSPLGGEVIPTLKNAYTTNTTFDVYVYLTTNHSAELRDLRFTEQPVWFVSSEQYKYDRRAVARKTENVIEYSISSSVFRAILHQRFQLNASDSCSGNVSSSDPRFLVTGSTGRLLDRFSGLSKIRQMNALKKSFISIYLVAFGVPHKMYSKIPACVNVPNNAHEAHSCLQSYDTMQSDALEHIVRGQVNLIEYVKPFHDDDLQNLWLGTSEKEGETQHSDSTNMSHHANQLQPHWKNHIDIRFVVDYAPLTPQALANPHLRHMIKVLPEEGVFLPILQPSDMWLLERNYVLLNETQLMNPVFNLTLTLNSLNMFWWSIQSQFSEIWNPSSEQSTNPWIALQRQSQGETFMLKRVMLDTNPYVLAFSAVFMLLHSVFSFLAVKNDIQFWHRNESMEGLSMLTILFNFFCDIVVALYLYDSKETSLLVLFEIGLGLVLSAWKVTKAMSFSIAWQTGKWMPAIVVKDRHSYVESETKKYDRIAIRFMSMLLFPCMMAYAVYALRYKKFRSWYSYFISTLAGTVYTFGFITMTPQLYINYKLKSVDHLPWRAFTYKALNTFVDDVAAFIIDMPWMHRLACFRDDIIFFCYLYQRWIYSGNKKRESELSVKSISDGSNESREAADEQQGRITELEPTRTPGPHTSVHDTLTRRNVGRIIDS